MGTPKDIDAKLAEFYYEGLVLRRRLEGLEHTAKMQAGADFYYRGRQRVTDMTLEAAEDILAADIAANKDDGFGYKQIRGGSSIGQIRTTVRLLGEVRTALTGVYQQTHALEAEYTGWSRFFLVTSSPGHIHSSMHCHTCRPTTTFAWLPDLSGKSEEEAVAQHGPALCTACFPTAPVEWTKKKLSKKDAEIARDRQPTWMESHVEEVAFLEGYHAQRDGGIFNDFLSSLYSQLHDRGQLTDNQVTALHKWMARPQPWQHQIDADRHQAEVVFGNESPTEGQVAYIDKLAEELGREVTVPTNRVKASALINELKADVLTRREPTEGQIKLIKELSERLDEPVEHTANYLEASDLIDRMQAALAMARKNEPATDKQISFINRLMDERKIALSNRRKARQQLDSGLTREQASKWITKLQELPVINHETS